MNEEKRYFIPLISVYTRGILLRDILPHVDWIGFNYFELKRSKYFRMAKEKGIRDTFGIDDEKKIFLASTAKDEELEQFYFGLNGIDVFKSDVTDFNVDRAMDPDWFIYCDQPRSEREKNSNIALQLNEQCISLENVVPNIHGTDFQEIRNFVEHFKKQGKLEFVIPGREYLINLDDRRRSQREFSFLTSTIAKEERISIITTGCSSPKLQESLPAVSGFVGLGWLIQARCRRLIFGKTFRNLFDPTFFCHDLDCCGSLDKLELAKPEHDSNRAIHNLRKIQSLMVKRPKYPQCCLVAS
jgi:hypothetical protein